MIRSCIVIHFIPKMARYCAGIGRRVANIGQWQLRINIWTYMRDSDGKPALVGYAATHIYPEWPHRQGGCLACWGCTFESHWGLHWFILCKWRAGSTAHEGGGCDQSIGSTISDAIVRSWLWLTATRSSPLGCFCTLLQVVDNWPHIRW